MPINLYVIRHAKAADRGEAYPDDSLRPLVKKGHKQSEMLSKAMAVLRISLDRLCSSPYVRATETAEAFKGRLKKGKKVIELTSLTSMDYDELLSNLQDFNLEPDSHIAIVGHEPLLSEFCSFMLSGSTDEVALRMKKATMVHLYGTLQAGTMTMHSMIQPKIAAAIVNEAYVDD